MRRLLSVALVLCAFSAPAFAQSSASPAPLAGCADRPTAIAGEIQLAQSGCRGNCSSRRGYCVSSCRSGDSQCRAICNDLYQSCLSSCRR